MKFEDICPFVRNIKKVASTEYEFGIPYRAYDNTLFYILRSSGNITVNGKPYNVSVGTVLILKPGVEFVVNGAKELEFILISFDYMRENSIVKKKEFVSTGEQYKEEKILCKAFFEDELQFNDTVHQNGMHFLEEKFRNMSMEFLHRDKFFDVKLSFDIASALIMIARRVLGSDDNEAIKNSNMNNFINYIHEHYTEDINNETIGKHFNLNPKYINELIKKRTGYSLHKYIIVKRISKAVELLQNTDMRISEITDLVGFSDDCHFSKYFKQMMGMSPRDFRMRRRPDDKL